MVQIGAGSRLIKTTAGLPNVPALKPGCRRLVLRKYTKE
jgi:hypothetical protein